MIRGTTRRHAAVQYAVFDPQTRVMKIASGGMPGPFHLSANGDCRALEVQGIPPGLFDPSVSYETLELPLEPGDSVLFFTDGLPDAFDAEDESFGLERLQAVCAAQSERSTADFLGEVFSAVTRFAASGRSMTIWLRRCFSIARNERDSLQRGDGPLCSDCARAAGFWIDTSRRLFKDSCSYLPT
jgi:serine phosphatase RsbU (regulator of sigma subunit)